MDEKYIDESMLVERYLEGTLTADQAASFEEQFLSSDELLNELEAAERLGQGLQDINALENSHATSKPASNIVSLFKSPRYAMAASFMLLVSLGVSSVLLQKNAQLSEFGSNQAIHTEIMPLVSVRGAAGNELNTLPLGDIPKQFVLMLDPGFEAYSHYRATVIRLDTAKEPAMLLQVDEMLPGYEDMLAISVPGSILRPGNYEVQLEGWLDEWPASHSFEHIDTKSFSVKK